MQPLEEALRIGGALSVAVFGSDGKSWWAGGHEPGDDDAAAAGALAGSATALIRMTDPDDELGDILVTTTTAFHVLRVLDPPDGGPLVAHLTLSRATAGLAMARREFKMLTDRYAAPPPPVTTPPPPPATDNPTGPGALPRRRPSRPADPPPDLDVPAAWLALVGQPFVTDDQVLDRIAGTLKDL